MIIDIILFSAFIIIGTLLEYLLLLFLNKYSNNNKKHNNLYFDIYATIEFLNNQLIKI